MTTDRDREAAQQCVTGWLRGGIKSPELTERLSRCIAAARREGCQQGIEAAAKVADSTAHHRFLDLKEYGAEHAAKDIAASIRALDPDAVLGDTSKNRNDDAVLGVAPPEVSPEGGETSNEEER